MSKAVKKAPVAGGTAPNEMQDHGFLFGWGFEDQDGHLWEIAYFDQARLVKIK